MPDRRSSVAVGLALLVLLITGAAPSAAQTWPQRPVKLVVPLGAGSGVDIGARLFADRLGARWGQPVIVENRPGGDGIVAINAFVSGHDDHTLLCTPTSSFTAHPYLHDSLPYKPSDLLPIARISNTLILLAVPTSLKADTLDDLFRLVRAEPGKLNWAGATGALDFLIAGFMNGAGLSMAKVPYRNPVEALNDLAEGCVQMYAAALAIMRPQVQAGKVRMLAVTNSMRARAAPAVPTATEAGYPGLAFDGLVGFFGLADTPGEVRARIAADVKAVGADPELAAQLEVTGQALNIGGPAEFAAATEAQRAKVAAMAAVLGIKPSQ